MNFTTLNSDEDFRKLITDAIESALNGRKSSTTLLSREKTSERLNVDLSTLWRWEKAGYLLPVRIGRAVYYKISDIESRERGEVDINK